MKKTNGNSELRSKIIDLLMVNEPMRMSEISKKLDEDIQKINYHIHILEESFVVIPLKAHGKRSIVYYTVQPILSDKTSFEHMGKILELFVDHIVENTVCEPGDDITNYVHLVADLVINKLACDRALKTGF